MKNIDITKKNYGRGLWSDEMIEKLEKAGKITKAEKDTMKAEVEVEKAIKAALK